MRKLSPVVLGVSILLTSIANGQGAKPLNGPVVKLGIDVLRARGFDILRGKRVGLITNPTGISADGTQTIDILFQAPEVQLVALFGPEHGVRGDVEAGKYIDTYTDDRTGLPVYSLYGRTRKPTREMLREIDVLVYDIQDIGVRSYTYISTMGLGMEAAAEHGLTFVVLDRPNPLTGNRVEGPMLDPAYKSFVGMYPIPYVYGMTAGELAEMINGEGWLNKGTKCRLIVVPMEGWNRSMWWDKTGLMWVPTSPHIPHWWTSIYYVLTGLLGELGTANQGVGYTLPFELVGGSWINGDRLAEHLNGLRLGGVYFRSLWYKPFYFDTASTRYHGVQIHIKDRDALNMTEIQLHILASLRRLYPDKDIFERAASSRIDMFDRVVGSSTLRRDLTNGVSVENLLRKLDQDRATFMIKREKYLLYE